MDKIIPHTLQQWKYTFAVSHPAEKTQQLADTLHCIHMLWTLPEIFDAKDLSLEIHMECLLDCNFRDLVGLQIVVE